MNCIESYMLYIACVTSHAVGHIYQSNCIADMVIMGKALAGFESSRPDTIGFTMNSNLQIVLRWQQATDSPEQGCNDTTIMLIDLTPTTVTLLTPQPHRTNPTSGVNQTV